MSGAAPLQLRVYRMRVRRGRKHRCRAWGTACSRSPIDGAVQSISQARPRPHAHLPALVVRDDGERRDLGPRARRRGDAHDLRSGTKQGVEGGRREFRVRCRDSRDTPEQQPID